jgi:hypothetical protein
LYQKVICFLKQKGRRRRDVRPTDLKRRGICIQKEAQIVFRIERELLVKEAKQTSRTRPDVESGQSIKQEKKGVEGEELRTREDGLAATMIR